MTVNGMDPRDEAEDYARDCRAAEREAARRQLVVLDYDEAGNEVVGWIEVAGE